MRDHADLSLTSPRRPMDPGASTRELAAQALEDGRARGETPEETRERIMAGVVVETRGMPEADREVIAAQTRRAFDGLIERTGQAANPRPSSL